jgi:DNA-binding transcriptional LysR family regulator
MIFRFEVTILSNVDSMSRCIRRRYASRAWSPEKLPICVGCSGASPQYLEQHGEPRRPRDLTRHQCLVHINSDPSDRVWRLRDATGLTSIKVQGSFASNSVLVLRKAALAALGIAILPLYCVKEDLKNGALREVLIHFPIPVHPLSLVFSPGKPTPQKIRSLGDFLVEWFRKHPIPQ